MPDAARRGLDRLLAEFPEHTLRSALNQGRGTTRPLGADRSMQTHGPWTVVTLAAPSGEETVYAIWNYTGSVYGPDPEFPGAVEDEPCLTLEPEPMYSPRLTLREVRALGRAAGLISGMFSADRLSEDGVVNELGAAQMKLETLLMIEQADR